MRFAEKLERAWSGAGSLLCVGLDPLPDRIPAMFAREARPILAFNRMVIDAVGDLVCAFKPQAAHHGAAGAENELADTIAYIRHRAPHALVILDAKRGDIGSTAQRYAVEAFERYDADMVTVSPFLGEETLEPFLERPDRGALVLCRTSNPGAGWIQTLEIDGEPFFTALARRAETSWNVLGNVGLVTGATWPRDIAAIRAAAPTLPFLVPGVGEQGGDPAAVMQAGAWSDGRGLFVSASRSVLWAGDAGAVRREAQALAQQLQIRQGQIA
ncbi:MAG TPA: orotidine-5'-phosphate decarboxylase [Caulobacteraceae bacterium]|nr:orotidine-5'-phosphate decarboxylase [Caulobacteraceae bacterium]